MIMTRTFDRPELQPDSVGWHSQDNNACTGQYIADNLNRMLNFCLCGYSTMADYNAAKNIAYLGNKSRNVTACCNWDKPLPGLNAHYFAVTSGIL